MSTIAFTELAPVPSALDYSKDSLEPFLQFRYLGHVTWFFYFY